MLSRLPFLFLLLFSLPVGASEAVWTLTPEAATVIQDLARPYELDTEVSPGWTWSNLSVERVVARLKFRSQEEDASVVVRRAGGEDEDLRGETFGFRIDADTASGERVARKVAEQIARSERERGAAGSWRQTKAAVPAWTRTLAIQLEDATIVVIFKVVWILLVGLLTVMLGQDLWKRRDSPTSSIRTTEVLAFLALLAGAFALRWALATWGPGDLRLILARAYSGSGADFEYGSAPNALLRLLQGVPLSNHHTALAVSLLFGSLAPLVLVMFLREIRFGGFWTSWLAGALLAVQPILIRHGGETNRQIYVLLLAMLALWGLARYLRRGDPLAALTAFVSTVLVHQSRPEGLLLLLVLGLLALFHLAKGWHEARTPRYRVFVAVGLTVVAGLAWMLLVDPLAAFGRFSSGEGEGFSLSLNVLHADRNLWLNPYFSSVAIGVLAALGLIVGIARRELPLLWAALALLGLQFVVGQISIGGPNLASTRYQTLTLPLVCLAAASGFVWLWSLAGRKGRRPQLVVGGLVSIVIIATSVGPIHRTTAPRTHDLAFAFILDTSRQLPNDARIYYVQPYIDANLMGLEALSGLGGLGHEWVQLRELPKKTTERDIYYHSGSCSIHTATAEDRALCDQALRRYGQGAIAEETLPYFPLVNIGETIDEIPVGFYRMK